MLSEATLELALALGLVRVLTLLPLYDRSLDEVERRLARTLEQIQLARALASEAYGMSTD